MSYVSPEDIALAKEMDLLTYLQNYEPQNLKRVARSTYCTREHDSLKISNGKWHWFSRGVGGKTALDYLIKVKDIPFIEAVETILGRAAVKPPVFHRQKDEKPRELLLPVLNDTADRVIRYLKGRGIHPVIIDYCLKNKLLFESRDYHNAVFIGYDPQGKMRYGNVRGTMGDYKGDLSGSDKHYSFAIPGESDILTTKRQLRAGPEQGFHILGAEMDVAGRNIDIYFLAHGFLPFCHRADPAPIRLQGPPWQSF